MAMYNFRHYADMLNLTKNVQELAKEIYANAEKSGKLKGKSFEAKMAATIYMASKIGNRPKNLRELIALTGCKRRDATKCYKMLSEFLPNRSLKTNMAECMTNLCNRVGVRPIIEQAARGCVEIV